MAVDSDAIEQMASGGGGRGSNPLLQDFFLKNIGKLRAYDFLPMSLKFYWLTLKKKFRALASLGSCQVTPSR